MTVAESIELPGYPENMGAQIVHEMASKTSEVAGAAGLNPMDLKPGIDMAVTAVVEDIKRRSIPRQMAAMMTPSSSADCLKGKDTKGGYHRPEPRSYTHPCRMPLRWPACS